MVNFYNFLTDLCNKSNMRPTIGEISENEYIFDVDSSTVFEFAVIKYLQEKEEIHLFRIAYVTNLEKMPLSAVTPLLQQRILIANFSKRLYTRSKRSFNFLRQEKLSAIT